MGLPDGHDCGSRCGGRSQRCQHDRKVQLQSQHKVDHDKHQHRGKTSLHDRDDHHLDTALFQGGELEELAGAEGDEGQCDICNKAHAVDHPAGHKVQAVGADEDARHDVGRHIRQPQLFRDAGHGKAGKQHQCHGYDDHRNLGGNVKGLINGGKHGRQSSFLSRL